ncbi:substrate-binding periplasmic protein [Radicibacter daui]|uniref:substrate-binding periplasmic protein n=1 Tax=Radicibacter daui TaxID=3064829 RepID=UPI004046CB31
MRRTGERRASGKRSAVRAATFTILALLCLPARAGCLKVAHWIGTTGLDWMLPPIAEAYKRAGLCVEWVPLPLARAYEAVQSGQIDADMLRTDPVIADMHDVVVVPAPLPGFDIVLMLGPGFTGTVTSLADLRSLKLVALLGHRSVDELPGRSGFSIQRVPDISQAIQMVQQGHADGMLTDANTYWRLDRTAGLDIENRPVPATLMRMEAHIVLNARHRDLVKSIDAAMRSVIADGWLDLPHGNRVGDPLPGE